MTQNEETAYTEEQVHSRLAEQQSGWSHEAGWIHRSFRTDGWPTTLMLVNQVGYLAEAAFHHPDLRVGYDTVEIRLQTHSAGGVTDKDLELARRIDEAVLWRPAPGAALGGTPNQWVRSGGRPES